MNTAECKDLIMKVMNQLIAKVGLDEMASYRSYHGHDIQDVLTLDNWKRVSKTGSEKSGSVTRRFNHVSVDASIVIEEVTASYGDTTVEFTAPTLPPILMRHMGSIAMFNDMPSQPSMIEGPKPEGFGSFA